MSQAPKKLETKCEDCQTLKVGVKHRPDLDAKLCLECYEALRGADKTPPAPAAKEAPKPEPRTAAVVADLIVKQAYAMEERKDLSMGKLLTLVREHKSLVKEAARAN